MIGKVYGKVRDHCHLTGRYRVAAQNASNINARQLNFIAIIVLNLSGQERQLFFKEAVAKKIPKVEIRVIPKVDEIFLSIRYGN